MSDTSIDRDPHQLPDETFVDAHGLQWRARPGWRDCIEAVVAPALIAADPAWQPLKVAKRRSVYALAQPGYPACIIKVNPPRPDLLQRTRERLRSRAQKEYEVARKLQVAGLTLPSPIAWTSRQTTGGFESYFVAEFLRGTTPIGGWLEARFQRGDRARWKRRLLERCLLLLEQLHELGLYHRDFHGGNLLLREAEGPAGQLSLIDLPSVLAIPGGVPDRLRHRDLAQFLAAQRVLDRRECDEMLGWLEQRGHAGDSLRRALARRRRSQARSRGRRAFVESSHFAQETHAGFTVSRRRSLPLDDLIDLIRQHDHEVKTGGQALVRLGPRARLSRHDVGERRFVVKEFIGGGAERRARQSYRGGVALEVSGIPVPQATALATQSQGPSYLVMAASSRMPLHLAVHRWRGARADRLALRHVARGLAATLAQLFELEVVARDLSPKNLLVAIDGTSADPVELVDWDDVQTERAWNHERIVRALTQIGDLPEDCVSRTERLRFVADLASLSRQPDAVRRWLRDSAIALDRRRHGKPVPDLPDHPVRWLAAIDRDQRSRVEEQAERAGLDSARDVHFFFPFESRRSLYDLTVLVQRTAPERVILGIHPEWDAPLLAHLRSQSHVALLDESQADPTLRTWFTHHVDTLVQP